MKLKPSEISPISQAYFFLHLSVALYGFTAILGKLIQLPGTLIVVYRMSIAVISLCLFPGILRSIRQIPQRARWKIAGIGVLVMLHWVTFYESIKYGNASITLSCFATTALFTSLIEPWVLRRPFRWYELLLSGSVIGGFIFMFGFIEDRYFTGIIIALVSALLAATFSVLTKTVVGAYDARSITLIQFVGGLGILLPFLPIYLHFFPSPKILPSQSDWIYLFILALVCTTFAYVITLKALKYLSAFTINLSLNLEPIYGILMAIFILQENKELNRGFYLGVIIIFITVLLYPVFNWILNKKQSP